METREQILEALGILQDPVVRSTTTSDSSHFGDARNFPEFDTRNWTRWFFEDSEATILEYRD